jgi:hypothetical protein
MSAGYAQLHLEVHAEGSPSGDCRTRIGMVLSATIKKLKEKEVRSVKAHEEWRALQRGAVHPWSQSMSNVPDSASIQSRSQLRPRSRIADPYSQGYPGGMESDPRVVCNNPTAFAPTRSCRAPSIAGSEYAIPRPRSTVHLPSDSLSRVAYCSSVESGRASRGCSSDTYSTDATSLPQSPRLSASGTAKQPPASTPPAKDDSSSRHQEFLSGTSSVNSCLAPSHLWSPSAARFQQTPTSQEAARVQAEMNSTWPACNTNHSVLERSESGSSYALSQYSASEQSYFPQQVRHPSSPARYRGGILRTIGTLPPLNSVNFPHSGIFAPRDGRSFAASMYSPVNPRISNATAPGLVCGQRPISQLGHHRPQIPLYPQGTPSRLSYVENLRHPPTPRPKVPTVDAFTGTLRSVNTASFDFDALVKGEQVVAKELRMQRTGVSSQSRKRPIYRPQIPWEDKEAVEPSMRIMNPKTGLPFRTLVEQLEERERLGATGSDRCR